MNCIYTMRLMPIVAVRVFVHFTRNCPLLLTLEEQKAKILRAVAFFCVYSLLGFRELRPGILCKSQLLVG
jgi:hypothetical protein